VKSSAYFQEPGHRRWWLPGVECDWEPGLHWKGFFFSADAFLVEGSSRSNCSHMMKDGIRHEEEWYRDEGMLLDDHVHLLVHVVDMKG
jgi:hypothetical protein